MDGSKYYERISQEKTRAHIDRETLSRWPEIVTESAQWSGFFYDKVSAFLAGVDDHTVSDAVHRHYDEYLYWANDRLYKVFNDCKKDKLPWPNELTFHHLNQSMSYSMQFLFLDILPTDNNIRFCQANTAVNGMMLAAARDAILGQSRRKDHIKLNEDERAVIRSFNGAIAESDTAVILLEFARKHPHLIPIAAPGRFEHSSDKSVNSDLMLIDRHTRDTVGVQVKANAQSSASVSQYDPDYIMVVDANADMNATKLVRHDRLRSKLDSIAWPGQACARIVTQIKQTGKNRILGFNIDDKELAISKFTARNVLGGMNVDIQQATSRIGERALHMLTASPINNPVESP